MAKHVCPYSVQYIQRNQHIPELPGRIALNLLVNVTGEQICQIIYIIKIIITKNPNQIQNAAIKEISFVVNNFRTILYILTQIKILDVCFEGQGIYHHTNFVLEAFFAELVLFFGRPGGGMDRFCCLRVVQTCVKKV